MPRSLIALAVIVGAFALLGAGCGGGDGGSSPPPATTAETTTTTETTTTGGEATGGTADGSVTLRVPRDVAAFLREHPAHVDAVGQRLGRPIVVEADEALPAEQAEVRIAH